MSEVEEAGLHSSIAGKSKLLSQKLSENLDEFSETVIPVSVSDVFNVKS